MKTIILGEGEGEKLWFYGGGVHTWKVSAEATQGGVSVLEDTLVRGKMTPLHRHPDSDEIVVVLDGEILVYADGAPQRIGKGGTVFHPRGVAHAFVVTSEVARILAIMTPGTQVQAFYRAASEPLAPSGDGPVDFAKVGAAAKQTGATEMLGPPPFAKPAG